MAELRRPATPPPEVLQYVREKELRPAFSWRDVWGEEHARAFTVAKVTEIRVLAEFRAGIDRAIVDGQGFEAFRDEMRRRLTPLGWFGPRTVADPSGRQPDATVDFSNPRRLQTTFWSNMRAARAAGQWERAQRTKKVLPFLLYVASTAERKRPEHRRWYGIILPIDDPFWRSHFPPNGWGCKCSVRQISVREATDLLGRGHLDLPEGRVEFTDTAPSLQTTPYRNTRTGEVEPVPAGIDPGWQTNPGYAADRWRLLRRSLRDELDAAPKDVARAAVADAPVKDFTEAVMAGRFPGRSSLPVARVPEVLSTLLGARTRTAMLSGDTIRRHAHHPEATPELYATLPQEFADEATLIRRGDSVVAAMVRQDGRPWVVVFKATRDAAEIFVTSVGYRLQRQVKRWLAIASDDDVARRERFWGD